MIHWHFKKKSPASGSHIQNQAGQAPTEAAQRSRHRRGSGRAAACGGLLPAPPCPDRAAYPVWAPVSRHYHETDNGSDKEMQLGA